MSLLCDDAFCLLELQQGRGLTSHGLGICRRIISQYREECRQLDDNTRLWGDDGRTLKQVDALGDCIAVFCAVWVACPLIVQCPCELYMTPAPDHAQDMAADERALRQALAGLEAALNGDLQTLATFREVCAPNVLPLNTDDLAVVTK